MQQHYITTEHQLALAEGINNSLLLWMKKNSRPTSRARTKENLTALLTELLSCVDSRAVELRKIDDRKALLSSQCKSNKSQLMKTQEEQIKMQTMINDKDAFDEAQKSRENIACFIDDIQSASNASSKLLDSNDQHTLKIDFAVLLDNRSSTTTSTILQSSMWGYRIRISVEITEQQYMAVSFCLMKGLYDEILSWPFEYPFSFHLVDLTGANQHIVHTVVPKSNQEIFAKPAEAANQPWSINQFCSVGDLVEKNSRYIQDNAMFLQFKIHYLGQEEFLSKSK